MRRERHDVVGRETPDRRRVTAEDGITAASVDNDSVVIGNMAPLVDILPTTDAGARTQFVRSLQQSHGNRYAQRVVSAGRPQASRRAPSRALQREAVAQDLADLGEAGEEVAEETLRDQRPPLLQAHNISDINAARRLLQTIEGFDAHMHEGASTKTVSGAELQANEQAKARLNDYLVAGGEQGRTLSTFQQQATRVLQDEARVRAQIVHLQVSGMMPRDAGGAESADALLQSLDLGTADDARAGVRTSDARTQQTLVEQQHQTLIEKSNVVATAQSEATQSVSGFTSALQDLRAGVITRETDPGLAGAQRDINSRVNALQSKVAFGLEVLSAVGGAANISGRVTQQFAEGVGRTLAEKGAAGIGSLLTPDKIAEAFSKAYYDREINAIEASLTEGAEGSRQAAIHAQLSRVREQRERVFEKVGALSRALGEVNTARESMRNALDRLGLEAGRSREERDAYAAVAGLLGDLNVLIVQTDMTLDLGRSEQRASDEASAARTGLTGQWNADEHRVEGGTTYFEPYQTVQLGNWTPWEGRRHGGAVWAAMPRDIMFTPPNISAGSAVGPSRLAVNPNVDAAIEQLLTMRAGVAEMREVLARAMGVNLASSGTGDAAGPGATGGDSAGAAGR